MNNCSICHSSKQPDGFDLRFAEDWETKPVPKLDEPAVYTLPSRYGEWEAFRASPMMADFRARMQAMAGDGPATPDAEDAFIKDNFLSNELRVPVTLVGTNSARAMATNAIRGNVWDNFSSESFKNLPPWGTSTSTTSPPKRRMTASMTVGRKAARGTIGPPPSSASGAPHLTSTTTPSACTTRTPL
ncbi:hypothetical protein [Verrucomicrobium spinosum]|uniref:hypothetical protein n=1 Tax=Verrucomicrobium spinosum TaxID=2736 RepID=UPI0009462F31|nr:hypothetical protein [Verrucomicrobium spinosum]